MHTNARYITAGVGAIIALLLTVALVVALYTQAFTPTATLTIEGNRAGLLTEVGSPVRLNGAKIGKVAETVTSGDGVALRLAINPAYLDEIAPDATAHISANTVLGGKSVGLTNPLGGPPGHIAPGAVIGGTQVTAEINTVFQNLASVLTEVQPNELNATLGGLATALRGHGGDLGGLLVDLNTYLPKINPRLPKLGEDFERTARVADQYNQISPDLLRLLGNFSRTAETVVDQRDTLRTVLNATSRTSGNTKEFLADIGPNLERATANTSPVLDLLANYSPEITCVVQGINYSRKIVAPIAGGNQPGLRILATLEPSSGTYRNPRDLPLLNATDGPNCRGLPFSTGTAVATYKDGTHLREDPGPPVAVGPLSELLFGKELGALLNSDQSAAKRTGR